METLLLHKVGLISFPLTKSASSSYFSWMSKPPLKSLIQYSIPCHLRLSNIRKTKLEAQGQGGGRGFGYSSISDKKDGKEEKKVEEDDEEIPQVVFDRMIRRIVFAVGSPMASGLGLLYIESYLMKIEVWQVPGWLPLLTILFSFGTSALGIAYGTLSTSMDPDTEGSFLGWTEVQKNWPELWKE